MFKLEKKSVRAGKRNEQGSEQEGNHGGIHLKVLPVNGSPHIKGCTYTALCEVKDALEKEGFQADHFWIGNKPLTGCIGCGWCMKNGRCHYDDSVNRFLETAKDYDGFVFGAPGPRRRWRN